MNAAPVARRFVCATHGHCFDGLASAALLRRMVRTSHPELSFEVHACGYGSRQLKPTPELLTGEGNAIVDFRYEPVDGLSYYFDHHRTAFSDGNARDHFQSLAAAAPSHFVFEPAHSSCTKLIAEVGGRAHGADFTDLHDLVTWADRIDSAAFSSAADATDRSEPVLRLAAVVEQLGGSTFLQRAAKTLDEGGLSELVHQPFVIEAYRHIEPKQQDFVRRVQASGSQLGRVAMADLTDQPVTALTKFVQYRLWPHAAYSVMITAMTSGIRIAVGHNPWSSCPLDVDVSLICARYGGGGHPMVGGIGLPPGEVELARKIAAEIVSELQTSGPGAEAP